MEVPVQTLLKNTCKNTCDTFNLVCVLDFELLHVRHVRTIHTRLAFGQMFFTFVGTTVTSLVLICYRIASVLRPFFVWQVVFTCQFQFPLLKLTVSIASGLAVSSTLFLDFYLLLLRLLVFKKKLFLTRGLTDSFCCGGSQKNFATDLKA